MSKKERIWNWFYSIATIFLVKLYFLTILFSSDFKIEGLGVLFAILIPIFFLNLALYRLAYMIDFVTNKEKEEINNE